MLSQFKSLSHSIQGVEAFFRYLMIDVMLAAPKNKDKEFASVISDEYRKFFKFERRKPLIFTTKAIALYQSSKNLSDLQVKKLQEAYFTNIQLSKLCNKELRPIRYSDLKLYFATEEDEAYLTAFKAFCNDFYTSYIHLAEFGDTYGSLDDYYKQLVRSKRTCRCCGISNILTEHNTPRDAFDHYLPKSIYPYVSVCFKNLVPTCYTCNSSYKGDIDTLYEEEANAEKQVKAFFPFSTDEHSLDNQIKVSIRLMHMMEKNMPLEDIEISFQCSGYEEELKNWQRIYHIEEQYKAFCADEDRILEMMDIADSYAWDKSSVQTTLERFESMGYFDGYFLKAALLRAVIESLKI